MGLEFGTDSAGGVSGCVSRGGVVVGAFDWSVGALVPPFAGAVNAFVGGGGVSAVEGGTDRRGFAAFFVVSGSLTVTALGV